MKSFFSNRNEIAKINTIFAMILVMVGISYYYLINLTTDLVWVTMCGFLFVAIPALFTLVHGAFAKRGDIVLLGTEFLILGVLGFVGKLLQGIGEFTIYSYLSAAAYAFSGAFVFSLADKVAFGKRMFAKIWFIAIMIIVSVVPTVLLYVLPENLVSTLILVEMIVNIIMFVAVLALGVYCIVKNKEKAFAWAYASYGFLMTTAYILQLLGEVRWYNLFLMLALISVPYIMLYGVKVKE